jgi:hypothetical protein
LVWSLKALIFIKENKMRVLVLTMAAAVLALAAGPGNPAMLETAKTNMAQMADKRIAVLQELKECVSKAADMPAVKQCKQTEMTKMKEIKNEAKAQRKGKGMGQDKPAAGPMSGQGMGAGGMPPAAK